MTFDPAMVAWVFTPADLQNLGAAIRSCTEVVVDLETTGLDEHATTNGPWNGGVGARIALASFTLPQTDDSGDPTTWVLPLSHPESPWVGHWRLVLHKVMKLVTDLDVPVCNANVKFDARWVFKQIGVDLSGQIVWDTQISSHLLDENASTKLKERAPATFGVERWDDFDLTVPGATERVPLMDLGMYAARDTYWTWRLQQLHRRIMFLEGDADGNRFEPEGPDDVENARLGKLATWVAMPTTATLTAIEQRGLGLDRDWVHERIAENEAERVVLFEDLASRYDLPRDEASFSPTSGWFLEWSEVAVAAGDLRVGAMTGKGRPSWGKGVLVRQARAGSEVAQNLLDYRQRVKRLEYLRSWLHHCKPDGRIHAQYNAGSVVTGRLSSSEPNLQQITKSLRPAFVPSPGHVIADFDYGQIELRIIAFISRCQPMIEAFLRGDDLHTMLAAQITGKAAPEVLPGERQAGKSANFGLVFGMGVDGFQEYADMVYGVAFTNDEAFKVHQAFFELWQGLREWHSTTVARAHRTGQVASPIGRVRRLPNIHDGNEYLASRAERQAINSPVQGFASDLMQTAAASIEGKLPGHTPVSGVRLVATVHDSIVAELPEDDWESCARQCVERMVTVPEVLRKLDCNFDIPLVADVSVGTRWGLSDIGRL